MSIRFIFVVAIAFLSHLHLNANQSGFYGSWLNHIDKTTILFLKKLHSKNWLEWTRLSRVSKRLKELQAMRKAGNIGGVEERLQGIQTLLRGNLRNN